MHSCIHLAFLNSFLSLSSFSPFSLSPSLYVSLFYLSIHALILYGKSVSVSPSKLHIRVGNRNTKRIFFFRRWIGKYCFWIRKLILFTQKSMFVIRFFDTWVLSLQGNWFCDRLWFSSASIGSPEFDVKYLEISQLPLRLSVSKYEN